MLGGWVNPHREQQTIPQGQTSSPPKSVFTPTAKARPDQAALEAPAGSDGTANGAWTIELVSPPLECLLGHIPFSRRWDMVRYRRVQLDTARYVRIRLETVGYSGIQWICCKMARCRSIQGYSGIPRIR